MIIATRNLLELSGSRTSGIGLELKNILGQLDLLRNCKGRLSRWDQTVLVLKALTYGWYAIISAHWPHRSD